MQSNAICFSPCRKPFYQQLSARWLDIFSNKKFDIIFTNPPFGTSLNYKDLKSQIPTNQESQTKATQPNQDNEQNVSKNEINNKNINNEFKIILFYLIIGFFSELSVIIFSNKNIFLF